MSAGPLLGGVRVVVFDVDDTLYLERDYVRSGFLAVEAAAGLGGFAAAAWSLFVEGTRYNTFDLALEHLGVPSASAPALVPRLVAIYREHTPDICLTVDAARAIEACEKAGLTLAIISDGPVASQSAKIRALGLSEQFRPVILTEDYGVGFNKPHRRGFEAVAWNSRRPAAEHVYVADNPEKDFLAPVLLGWMTVRVRRGGSLHEATVTPPEVSVELPDLAGLPALLGLPNT
jgi:putative hydrolase of the HAD superfamily